MASRISRAASMSSMFRSDLPRPIGAPLRPRVSGPLGGQRGPRASAEDFESAQLLTGAPVDAVPVVPNPSGVPTRLAERRREFAEECAVRLAPVGLDAAGHRAPLADLRKP